MAVMPGVDYRPVAGLSSRITRYDIVCVHTIVGNDPAPAAHFSTRGDGYITQNRDTVYRSAANLNGNYRVIAIENDDHGPEFGSWSGSNVPAFTAAQCESIARICVWAHRTHGIPLALCPDSRPGSRGIGYHRQGIDGNFGPFRYGGRVSGGELWTEHFGKVCPGDRRITQLIEVIIPRARVLAGIDAPPEVDVELTDKVTWWDGKQVAVGDIFAEVFIAARGLNGKPAFSEQGAPVQLPPIVGIRTAVEGLSDDEAMVLAAISSARGDVLTAVAAIDGAPSDEQVADLADKLNAQLGGAYNVTITRTSEGGGLA